MSHSATNASTTMLMSGLLHMHKPGGDPGVFLNTCWGDLELLGFSIASYSFAFFYSVC